MKYRSGDLTIAARIGDNVRCIRVPDISSWEMKYPLQVFIVPEVGKLYKIRQHILTATRCGVLLIEIKNLDEDDPTQSLDEPFFEYSAFNFVSAGYRI